MPDLSSQLTSFVEWLSTEALTLLLVAVVLLLLYRFLQPRVHDVLVRLMQAQRVAVGADQGEHVEIDRRVATIEDLVTKLLRTFVLAGFVAVLLGLFNLWPALAGLGLVFAALTLAGQSIILDYLMGVLILLEGQYFKGDTVQIGGVEGVVEEVGLRRTVVRDVRGTLHSISNGTIRQSGNLTRTFAAATVDIDGVDEKDVETVIRVLNAVGAALLEDDAFGPLFHEPAAYAGTTRFTAAGSTIRMSGRVRPEARARVEAEMRRRVAGALAAEGVELIRPVGPYARV